jgi:hypothetical protein
MRLVAVSVVKNEADIIEPFVRHTLAWADRHLVFDHDSTDGTREILTALRREGLPVALFCDDAPGHLQQARSNYLTRIAAEVHGADWVLPLDADEILCGPGRGELESALTRAGPGAPVSLPLLDYCTTPSDDATEGNPVLRLRHCQQQPSPTRKIFLPRPLALDRELITGKGSHAIYRGGDALHNEALPEGFLLAHLALRSPEHQVLRVVRAELQRLSRGRVGAGLDIHYRLGYQLLAENPELFFTTVCPPAANLRLHPIDYRGGPLKHVQPNGWSRVARALGPYLEQLAVSHGHLADVAGVDIAPANPSDLHIREIAPEALANDRSSETRQPFAGFTALHGWGYQEGPVPEAFLPVFHWGYAPATTLAVDSARGGSARAVMEMLTYSDDQVMEVELNGQPVGRQLFPHLNQKERLSLQLELRPGRNELVLRYRQGLVAAHDPRRLAAIFLRLQVIPA